MRTAENEATMKSDGPAAVNSGAWSPHPSDNDARLQLQDRSSQAPLQKHRDPCHGQRRPGELLILPPPFTSSTVLKRHISPVAAVKCSI